jgi:hypothetical protein
MIMNTNLKIAQCGISDVVGGRMWFCVKPDNPRKVERFYTKRECEAYIRKEHNSNPYLLKELRNTHGRAFIYA